MGISPIGAISAIEYQPYVYNTNAVSASSMDSIAPIADDVLSERIDYNVDDQENINPLKKGQSLNFADIIMEQMSKGQANAARVMVSEPETGNGAGDMTQEEFSDKLNGKLEEEMSEQTAEQIIEDNVWQESMKPVNEPTLFQRKNAASAYEANMIA